MSVAPNEKVYQEAEIVEDAELLAPTLKDIKYPLSAGEIDTLLAKYAEVPTIDLNASDEEIGESYKFVLAGHKEFVKVRNKIEKTRKTLKEPALNYGRKVDSIAKEFQAKIKPIEDKLYIQRKAVEDNEARKQREAEERELQRVVNIKTLMNDYETHPMRFINSSSQDIDLFLRNDLKTPTPELFEEFFDEAFIKYNACFNQLVQMKENQILVENAKKIQEQQEAEAKQKRDEDNAKSKAREDELAKREKEFQAKEDAFNAVIEAQQEEQARLEAARLADEFQAKQEFEAKVKLQQNAQKLEDAKQETTEALAEVVGTEDFMNAIFENKIPHLKFEVSL